MECTLGLEKGSTWGWGPTAVRIANQTRRTVPVRIATSQFAYIKDCIRMVYNKVINM
jgi:hypothetical protein